MPPAPPTPRTPGRRGPRTASAWPALPFDASTGGDETQGKVRIRAEMQVQVTAQTVFVAITLAALCFSRSFDEVGGVDRFCTGGAIDLRIVKLVASDFCSTPD